MSNIESDGSRWGPGFRSRYLYALRRLGREGWRLRVKEEVRDRVEDWADEPGAPVLEVRRVTTYGTPEGNSGSITEGDAVYCDMSASWAGWHYDEAVEGWRAPGEPFAEPPGAPRPSGSARMTLDRARCGWLDLRLQVGRGRILVRASDVFDPLQDILAFGRQVRGGGCPRLYIDEEGESHTLHTFPRGQDDIRLLVIAHRRRWRAAQAGKRRRCSWETLPVLDRVVSRTLLATAVQRGLQGYLDLPYEQRYQWSARGRGGSEQEVEDYDDKLRRALQRDAASPADGASLESSGHGGAGTRLGDSTPEAPT